jgi:hypothetical protein
MLSQTFSRRALWGANVKTAGAVSTRGFPKVGIERNDHEILRNRVVDDHDVLLAIETNVTRASDRMTAPIEQRSHWLDHVVVDEEP